MRRHACALWTLIVSFQVMHKQVEAKGYKLETAQVSIFSIRGSENRKVSTKSSMVEHQI
jgi:hypothetical protein